MALQFQPKDFGKIPEHWKTFGSRHSLIQRKANRNATNPANALLNYIYAILFAETRLSLMRAGLDTTAGIFHADTLHRDSFTYDVMEAIRSDIDDWLLNFVENHVFSKKDFYEKNDGSIRLTLKITPILAETVSLWSERIEPVVKNVLIILEKGKEPVVGPM